VTQALRIAQATAWYPPHHLGGTEVYVAGLVRELRNFSANSFVLTPAENGQAANAYSEGSRVLTYPVPTQPTAMELQRRVAHAGFDQFRSLLMTERPQIYHQHSWTRGLGKFHLRAAHEAGLRTVLTIHVANFVCLRGTMMRFGSSACSGLVAAHDCSACWSQQRGAPKALSHIVAATPHHLGRFLIGQRDMFGRLGTLLATSHLVEEKRRELVEAAAHSDRIVAVCQWLYDALILNGVPEGKLVLCRNGIDLDVTSLSGNERPTTNERLGPHIVFLGRSDPTKGAQVLVEAAARTPAQVNFRLDLYCLGTELVDERFKAKLLTLANGDKRIHIRNGIPRDQVAATLAEADILAVPSVCLETGPMVVLEAKAIGLKVLGSRLGGIAELIAEPGDGILIEAANVEAWKKAITEFARSFTSEPQPRPRRTSRSMYHVAAEMAALYRELL
jgi:glycosyltransferase involved in cell wall biosynthesis